MSGGLHVRGLHVRGLHVRGLHIGRPHVRPLYIRKREIGNRQIQIGIGWTIGPGVGETRFDGGVGRAAG
jgi:hypothetical protein